MAAEKSIKRIDTKVKMHQPPMRISCAPAYYNTVARVSSSIPFPGIFPSEEVFTTFLLEPGLHVVVSYLAEVAPLLNWRLFEDKYLRTGTNSCKHLQEN